MQLGQRQELKSFLKNRSLQQTFYHMMPFVAYNQLNFDTLDTISSF